MKDNRKKSYLIDEKQVIFKSGKYTKKAKDERAEVIKKGTRNYTGSSKYNKDTVHGVAMYI